ncbi:NAD-dependent succinate-semialdehyde dehydrogenase [Rhizobium leucaenae]|uniref:Succinate-semialdehyde dehydrogenase/glutarate-semialdehyde dehydrogenase n=1 Tax=Rhizobium leucaenae TaxID=29450 RepID=A0A7W7EKH2_9HYPH|nr:NAD-dependent succinate-semialdehyde dehydrogenase [Rhizobium leucaenae]MBB4568891.1 succinate-semialdehyde dehydrogenase/glutarate-semialdehyde dehydrogenase [Rhizobium leucaenae]MBB6302032.1 succinate-semialdehyde dehydrogenase/glutarate-semialdehyde dehydrogenase [Rhizobium leucaenae]
MKLNDLSLFRQACPIAGNWIEAKDHQATTIRNPATGEVLGAVPDLGATETEEAIRAAVIAQKLWAKKTAGERATILKAWHRLMIENIDDLAMILTLEQGKPLVEAKGEIAYGASFIEWFAEEARRINGETIPGHQQDKRILVLRQPAGVVAAITPWNFPNAMVTRKVGPALAAGCAVVLKPAPQTPFSAIALAVLAERAGLPPGLLNIVTGDAAAIGGALTASPAIRVLTFTGSTRTGELLYRQCAPSIKKLGLELGGNAPFIVFDDADLDAAVEGAIIAKFRNNGQTCVCANRLYVQDGVYEAFAAKLAAAVEKLTVGNGLDQNVVLGPLIDENAVLKVEAHIRDAVANGAEVISGGNRHSLGGNFFEPTVLRNVDDSMQLAREETFGPVAPLFRFRDESDVIEQANDTEFGLASYFYARELSRVFRVAEALEYGMVGVNTGLISTAEAPFGGVKMSGLGREGSRHGIDEYTELKYVCLGGLG